MSLLEGKHFVFRSFGTFALLPPDLGDPLVLLTLLTQDLPFQFFSQHPTRPVPVHGLRSFLLTFEDKACGSVLQDHARGYFVDVLPPRPSGAHERFLKILLSDSQPRHFERKILSLFF